MNQRAWNERPSGAGGDADEQTSPGNDLRNRALQRRLAERRSGGGAIDESARAPLERSFGRSFADVRVHEDGVADERGAHAVTHGKDIHFARGKLAPASPGGRALLAHELTHVVQQDGAAAPQLKSPEQPALRDQALEREADDIGTRAAAGHPVAGAIRGRTAEQAPQHFEEVEHKLIGDTASGEFASGVELVPGYRVSYGDIVALAGDYFGTMKELQDLAKEPGDHGQKPGSRDEVEYALRVQVQGQTALEDKFSDKVKHNVSKRFYGLASKNVQHFDNPRAKDRARDQGDKDRDRDQNGHGVSAGSTFRENHDRAIELALQNGRSGKPIDEAVATEAFGHHFLTDAFSAGHVRTPRGDAKSYWNARVPMFLYNFKHYMAQEIARRYPKVDVATAVTTTDFRMDNGLIEGSLPKIEKKFEDKGIPDDFGFGEIVSGALHDYDNLHGAAANVDGQTVTLAGDGHLLKPGGKQTFDLAVKAVETSLADVRRAYDAGKQGQDAGAAMAALKDDKGMYAAERMIPQAVPEDDPAQQSKSIKWDYESVDALLGDGRMVEALALTAREKAHLFDELAKGFDEDARKAFYDGVINPLKSNPIQFLKNVVDYTPNTGGGLFGHATAGEAGDYVHAAQGTAGGLASLSMAQKQKLVVDAKGMPAVQVLLAKLDDAPALIEHASWRALWNKLGDDNVRGQFLSMFAEQWWHGQSYGARKTELKNLAAFDELTPVSLRSVLLIFRSSTEEEQQRLYAEVLQYDRRTQWHKQLESMGIHVRDR